MREIREIGVSTILYRIVYKCSDCGFESDIDTDGFMYYFADKDKGTRFIAVPEGTLLVVKEDCP